MTIELSGISSVLARIAQIQAGFPANPVVRAATAPAARITSGTSTALAPAISSIAPDLAASAPDFAAAVQTVAPDFATALAGASDQGTSQPSGANIVASAEKYLGVPYVFGGTTSSGLDCSGLVQRAYGDLGISLPRIAADQARVGTAVASLDQARPGDILGFGDPAHHVALYLGAGKMIAAPEPGDKVKIQNVYETPASIRRVVAGPAALDSSLAGSAGLLGQSAPIGLDQYAGIFTQNEARFQLPQGLLAAVAQTESGGNAAAVSPAGAQGLMQLMPSTAQGLGVNPWVPGQAVQGAAQLLSKYLHSYGSVPLALAAYNAGPGAVEQYGGVPPYRETQNYVAKITGLMAGGAS